MPKVHVPERTDSVIIKKRRIEALKWIHQGESRRKIESQRLCTHSSIRGSIHSLVKGYNIAEPGHRQKMNTHKANLESWIVEHIKRVETIFAPTVIKMVWTRINLSFSSDFSLGVIHSYAILSEVTRRKQILTGFSFQIYSNPHRWFELSRLLQDTISSASAAPMATHWLHSEVTECSSLCRCCKESIKFDVVIIGIGIMNAPFSICLTLRSVW